MSLIEYLIWRGDREVRIALKPGVLQQWIEQAAQGDEQAIERLHNYVSPFLRKSVEVMLPPSNRKAILQETLARIDRNLAKFDPHKGRYSPAINFNSWSFAILKNSVSDLSRYQQRQRPPRPIRYSPKTLPEIVPDYEERVARVLDPLDSRQREVVVPMLEGKTRSETARLLGLKPATVRQRLHRNRALINQAIEREFIIPYGLVRISQLDDSLSSAARDDRLERVRFFGFWYTTQDEIERFYPPPQHNPPQTQRGLFKLVPTPLQRIFERKRLSNFLQHNQP